MTSPTATESTPLGWASPPAYKPAWIRDVPASCICGWTWYARGARYVRTERRTGCPWHWRAL